MTETAQSEQSSTGQNWQMILPRYISALIGALGLITSWAVFYFLSMVLEPKTGAPKILWLALLPYLGLLSSVFVTAFLVYALDISRQKAREITRLATTLSTTNTELTTQIEERERISTALRDQMRKYRSIFENTLIGIAQIAPDGRWLGANPAIARLLGYADPEHLLAEQPDLHERLFIDPEVRQDWWSCMQGQKPQRMEYEADLRRADGRVIRSSLSSHAMRDESGVILYYDCALLDISGRHAAQRALLLAKEQADMANRTKSDFLANMSHELRTPLNAIIGFAEIIQGEMFGPVGQPQYVEYARDIYDSGQLLLSLINDILDMAKVEAGKRTLHEGLIDVNAVIQSCLRLVTPRAKSGRIKLTAEVSPDLPGLWAEEKALKQVITNLLSNAVKFTPEGGSVTVTAGKAPDGRVRIAVTDTGIGMAHEDIPIALAPFGQIESALSRKTQGTGLGLPITKSLIELHGGNLAIDSTPGKGTTVSIFMPARRLRPKINVQPSTPPQTTTGGTVS